MAASGVLAAAADRHPLLPGFGATGRGRAVRLRLPGRPARARRGRGAGGAHLARAHHRPRGTGRGDQPDRVDRHGVDHLYRAVQSRAPVRVAGSHQQRPRGLEHRHVVARYGGAQLRRRRPGEPRRSLCPRRGVHDAWSRRCGTAGPTTRWSTTAAAGVTRKRGPHPADQPQGRVLSGGRAAEPAALPAGPAGTGAGGIVRHRPPLRRAACRGGVHRAHGEGDRAGVLRRPEGAGGGRGAGAGPGADPAGLEPDDRLDRGRGAAPGARGQRAFGSRGRTQAAVRPVRRA